MKRFISVLSSLLVLPAFAEVAPVYYDDAIEYSDAMIDDEDVQVETSAQKPVSQKTVANRSTSTSRAVASGATVSSRSGAASRAVASSPRTATSGVSRGTVARTAKTSNANTRTATKSLRASVTSRNTATKKPVTARVGVYNNAVMSGDRTSCSPVVLTATEKSLYNPSASSRVGVANRRASSRLSTVSVATTAPVVTQEEVTSTASNLSAIAELTDYCKAQYAACMDNYCNVLDDNQGRCSCSKNVKNYEKTETALAQATEDFQNVVQQIRYIGLTGDQVEALFTETEAELTMKSTTDTSRLKNSLDLIKKKILDVNTPSATSTVTNGLSLDLNGLLTADFSAGFDLNSFLNMNNQTTESVSNQRGEQLYKTAANRCKTSVLNSCNVQGVDVNVITNAYDLEIDKQCVLYERSLNDANAEMKQNATNATTILQQARLLLAQNRNSYDLRGCIAAIDSCMQDEYVCGTDYELCLDPTGKYIANGEIIRGGTPGVSGGQNRTDDIFCPTACEAYTTFTKPTSGSSGSCGTGTDKQACKDAGCDGCKDIETWTSGGMRFLYSTWDYSGDKLNAWSVGASENLGAYVDDHLTKWKSDYTKSKDTTESDYLARYLLQKVGYIDSDDKVHGMCASVMKQCQDYTYTTTSSRKSTKKYKPDNEVIRQYLNATLPKIKVQQDAILADYAENCKADVQSCLSTNGYEESNTTSTASKTAINACASEITTCMSVGGYQIKEGASLTIREMGNWVKSLMITCPENYYVYDDGTTTECLPCGSADVLVDAGILRIDLRGEMTAENPNKPYFPVINANAMSLDMSAYADGNETSGRRPVAVQLVSAGGHATSCSCPSGYTDTEIKSFVLYDDEGNVSCPEHSIYACEYHFGATDANRRIGKKACIDTSVKCHIDESDQSKLTCD